MDLRHPDPMALARFTHCRMITRLPIAGRTIGQSFATAINGSGKDSRTMDDTFALRLRGAFRNRSGVLLC
jgi:hypothetical protein